jgi:hypothetical protein
MQSFLSQTWGVLAKDVRQWSRDRQAAFGPLLMPIVLMLIVTVLFGAGGDEWNIALIVEEESAAAQEFAQTIETLESSITPYYRIITRDPERAHELVQAGRLHMAITIPASFDERLNAGAPPIIETHVFNINTDMMKNVRLRLEAAIQEFQAARGATPVTVEHITTRSEDVWRRAFIAGGAVVVALLVGASLNTALMVAREWERTTVKELRLAPGALAAIMTGKLLAGLVAATVNVAVALAVAVLVFGLRIAPDRWLPLLGIGLGVAVTAAGVGLGIGALFRDYRTVQPLLLVTAAGSFFASGGYASIATLPPLVRTLNTFWPPAYVFEAMQLTMHSATLPDLTGMLLALPLAAVAGVVFGWLLLRRVL